MLTQRHEALVPRPSSRRASNAMDNQSKEKRSKTMASVRQKNTKPELLVRSEIHRLGGRFVLHARNLPGRPDIVLPGRSLCIFVHGCFWHRHESCRLTTTPSTNVAFWIEKFRANIARDERKESELRLLGWNVAVIWECETRDRVSLAQHVSALLAVYPYVPKTSRKTVSTPPSDAP